MTAHEDPEIDPQNDAESLGGAPQTADESARSRDLAELFAPLGQDGPLPQVDDSAGREHLAALFAGQSASSAQADAEPDFSWQPESVPTVEPASAWAPEPAIATRPEAPQPALSEPDAAPVSASAQRRARTGGAADAAHPVAASAAVTAIPAETSTSSGEAAVDGLGADAAPPDPLAWLDRLEQDRTPEKAALGSWLGVVGARETSALPASVAAAAFDAPTQVVPGPSTEPTGSFSPAQRRGVRAWSSRVRWSVAVSILLLVGVVIGSVVVAQIVAANNLAAQQLAAAMGELEAAEESATQPQSVLDDAVGHYDDTVESAQATADSAGPPLAAIAGMAAQPLLDASNAALAALNAQIVTPPFDELPKLYKRGEVDGSDIDAVTAATTTAEKHAELVTTATRAVRAAQAALQEKLDALRAAQVALGASLPETAVLIVGENPRALQSFRDSVIAASVAVPAAQNAGGSGDAEMLAYAAAVTALRNDQTRAQTGVTPVTPPSTGTNPAPVPDPVPVPDPAPVPEPTPTPTPTETTPPPVDPTDPPAVP